MGNKSHTRGKFRRKKPHLFPGGGKKGRTGFPLNGPGVGNQEEGPRGGFPGGKRPGFLIVPGGVPPPLDLSFRFFFFLFRGGGSYGKNPSQGGPFPGNRPFGGPLSTRFFPAGFP
eukprot:FR736678.1.p1 GENE.FR736678.1~~FR736678.1.p1  ORF type:complete len:115 (-),score=45.24 FR736678.1:56-400(-)